MMDIKELLKENKQLIMGYLERVFKEMEEDWSRINEWGPDALRRLKEFMGKGKMVRGSFVLWTAQAFGATLEDSLPGAAALEFLQAALLVHDDIMDEDDVRRGIPSMHRQYEHLGAERGVERPDHFGVSMGICNGDLAIFLAYHEIAKIREGSLIGFFSEKVAIVGLGQMQDMYWGVSPKVPGEEDILSMYQHKTSMYTFCLPFLLGARVANQNGSALTKLELLGNLMGQLFQIKDDELGLYGEGEELGKTVGIDLLAEKKTIYYSTLLSSASPEEVEKLRSLRSSDVDDFLSYAYGLLDKHDVRSSVQERVDAMVSETESIIDSLPLEEDSKELLRMLLVYIMERKK